MIAPPKKLPQPTLDYLTEWLGKISKRYNCNTSFKYYPNGKVKVICE